MKKLKIGQIGLGHNHGERKLMGVMKYPELFEVIGYAEDDEKWIAERGNNEGYRGLKRFSQDELIEKCDVILVETDVWNLTKTAKKCVDAGVHVHIDKPASGSYKEFEEVINTAREKKLVVQMGYMYRYNFAVQKLMDMVAKGELGEVYQIDAEMSTYHPAEYRKWLGNFKGGSMYIFGCHLIDLALSILGEPKAVHPFIKRTGFEGIYSDDNCFALLEYDRAVARITTLSVEPNGWGMRRIAVMGSKATVEIKPIELDVEMYIATPDMTDDIYSSKSEKIQVDDVPAMSRYDEMVRDLYSYIVGEKENPYTYDHELLLQRTLFKAINQPETTVL